MKYFSHGFDFLALPTPPCLVGQHQQCWTISLEQYPLILYVKYLGIYCMSGDEAKWDCVPPLLHLAGTIFASSGLQTQGSFLLITLFTAFFPLLTFPSSLPSSSLYSPPSLWVNSVWLVGYCSLPSNTLHTAIHAEYTHAHRGMFVEETLFVDPLDRLKQLCCLFFFFWSIIFCMYHIFDRHLKKISLHKYLTK